MNANQLYKCIVKMHDKDSTCKYEHALILFHLCANLGYMLRIYIVYTYIYALCV